MVALSRRWIQVSIAGAFSLTLAGACRSVDHPQPAMGDSTSRGATVDVGSCNGGSCNAAPAGLLNPDFTTTWNPGILADTPTGRPLGRDGLPVRTTVCAKVPVDGGDAAPAIQSALDRCKNKHQVVELAAGTYKVGATVHVPSGVVLRGAGSEGGRTTTLLSTKGGPVLAIGAGKDTVCYNNAFVPASQPLLTKDAPKESSTIEVESSAGFAPGDLALVDQTDIADVDNGDCGGAFKRAAGRGTSERVEIAKVAGNTLTLTTPLHWTFSKAQKAQISKSAGEPVKWAGIENLRVQGGRPGGYHGQNAGGVEVSGAAYSWVKDVQVDGTTSGMPMRLVGTYRSVIRDSHVHHSYSYGFAQDNYGIVLACGAADNLVENNVARFMNKPIMFNNTGGGNVAGYNYVDNSWSCNGSNDDGFQEASIDCHCAFPHMELMEGNWAPHMAASVTHGNAGYLTFYRNYASSQWSPSKPKEPKSAIVWSQPFMPQYANVTAIQLDSPDVKMTVIGNVLGSTTNTALGLPADLGTTGTGDHESVTSQSFVGGKGPSILKIDPNSVTWKTLWMTGNFDAVNGKTMWNASPLTENLPASTRALPASLYLAKRPGWWPAGTPWPWVGPELNPKVGKLPAHERSIAFDYSAEGSPPCTLNCNRYCCSVGASCTL